MKGKFFVVMLVGLALTAVLSHGAHAQENQPVGAKEYTIAVLSPNEGPLREVGALHRKSVRQAFGLENEDLTINIHDHTLRFHFLGTDDPVSDTTTGVEQAKSAEAEGAIAILGPVASGCTKRVLSEDLEVPVISSLSTATDLGDQDKWFFRTIAHDYRRLEVFVDTARARGIAVESSIAIYDSSDYGVGLLGHLRKLVPDIDSTHIFWWDDIIEDITHGTIDLAKSFRRTMKHHHAIENVFVLGSFSSERMDSLIWALDDMFEDEEVKGDPNFVLVGSVPNAINLPENTWIIGEAQVQTSQNLITEITARNPSADLYISTFDASIALKEAIRDVLDQSSPDSVSIFRRKLRKALQEGSFFSSERRRRVEFTNGEILEPPKTPLYRVSVERHVENINLDRRKSWVEIRINDDEQPTSHLEGPMVVELIPHGEDLVGKEVQLQVEGVDDDPVTVQKVELNRHGSRVTFVPSSFFWETWFPNTFMMSTNETPVKERVKVEGLGWPVSYLLAVLIALFGALLYIWHKKQRKKYTKGETTKSRMTLLYVVERCVAGIVIAFLIIHIAPILEAYPSYSWIPVPQFGSSPWISAVISGLMGGWLGLNPIVGLVASVIGTFTPLFKSDS